MAAEQLTFQGINRAITDYSLSGACEELINLRPTTGGLVPVKPFSVKMASLPYSQVIAHSTQDGVKYLAFKLSEEDDHYLCEVWQIDENGNLIGETYITSFYCEGEEDLKDIHHAEVGNILYFSVKENNGYLKNTELLWNGTEYELREADIPEIEPTITPSSPVLVYSTLTQQFSSSTTKPEITSFIENSFNEIQETHKNYCFGPVIIAIAFKTNDGKTFWTSKWMVYDPIPEIKENLSPSAGSNYHYQLADYPSPSEEIIEFFRKHTSAYTAYVGPTSAYHARMAGVTLSMTIPQVTGWNKETSILKSVEVYASRPQLHLAVDDFLRLSSDNLYLLFPEVLTKDMELGSQLLYLQKSIQLDELTEGDVSFNLEFGGNIQTTNTTLKTDAGAVTRYGKLLAFNARFHLYDSIAEVAAGMPWFSDVANPTQHDLYTADVYIVFNDGQKDTTLYAGIKQMPYDDAPGLVISPDIRVKEVILQIHATPGSSDFYQYYHFAMTPSSRYNYSFCDSGPTRTYIKNIRQYNIYQTYIEIEESSALNVSEQYNPFVFDVDHSYLAPGKILDVKPQMVAVQDVSFGDYPLNIFTDRGVYALLQGSGTVLYGNFRSISNLVSDKNSIPTESGTFFIASGGLWAIAGSKAVLISDALHLGPHKFIRRNSGYQALSNGAYDVQELESNPLFEDYVEGATLCYNRFRDEIYVSNPDFDYSYAISLKYRQWFKIAGSFMQDMPGSTIVSTKTFSGTTDILDFSDETEGTSQLVHLQSRPFSFGYMYSHIHRIVSLVRAALSTEDILIAAIYGSDDLQNWVLLSYSGRSSKNPDKPLELSQLRTPPAARSWRYYTICIGGVCPTDTDFGPVIVDYQPVIRRLG